MLIILTFFSLIFALPAVAQPEIPPLRQPTQVNIPVNPPPTEASTEPDAEAPNAPAKLPMGALHVDAKVPAEIVLNGQRVGQLFLPSELRVPVPAGTHALSVVREGRPESLEIEIHEGVAALLVIGRTGTTASAVAPPDVQVDPSAPVPVELRIVGTSEVQVRLADSRLLLSPGQLHTVHLAPGRYATEVRSPTGTVIWARGTLEVKGGAQLILQLSEGRLPELTGDGRFVSTRN